MAKAKPIIGLVGSPNKDGLTNQVVSAALTGAAKAGASIELIQMSDHVVDACRDCLPWVCKDKLKCTFPDEAFAYLSQKIIDCGGLVLGTPVYWWDTSGLVRYLIIKMLRVFARTAPTQGLPCLGLAIAGGSGNGLISGLRPLYQMFQLLQMRALAPVPATRFNFAQALSRAEIAGSDLAAMAASRHAFSGFAERHFWYDNLPYLGLNIFGERQLLASLTVLALPPAEQAKLQPGLALANALAAAGRGQEALDEITKTYEAAVEIYQA